MKYLNQLFKNNPKVLVVFFVLLIFQVILILNAREDYTNSFEVEKLKPLHFAFQSEISKTLMSDCKSFNDAYIESLKNKAKKLGVELHTTSEVVNAIDALVFEKIILTSSLLNNNSVTYSTHGYKIIYSANKNCFGTI